MHLGNASSALLAWLSVRARTGTMVLRMEDLDRGRVRPGLAARLLEDLAWLGLDWDEGPDRGGEHGPYEQSARMELYREACERLERAGRIYPCFCSRRDIAAAASAPQAPGDEVRYPGTCSRLPADEVRRRLDAGRRHSWRFRVDGEAPRGFDDLVYGPWTAAGTNAAGDFVVWRFDGTPAYQLAVVVDDAAMGIDEVVRGADLLASTVRQLTLYRALDLRPPRFGHVPLLLDPDGVRLSKRQQGITLRELRDRGFSAEGIVGRLAGLLGLAADGSPRTPAALLEGFTLAALCPAPRGIAVDVAEWWDDA
jgi:glutamyl-tRNA synthetase